MTTIAIQDRLFPHMRCFGCGPDNAEGLRLKSFPDGPGRATAEFLPWPAHDNGLGYLNGGIIATVLDCHSAAAVMQHADERGWDALPGASLAYVTAGLNVSYRRPAPLDDLVSLVAEVQEASEDAITCAVRLEYDGKVRAEATALWKRWRALIHERSGAAWSGPTPATTPCCQPPGAMTHRVDVPARRGLPDSDVGGRKMWEGSNRRSDPQWFQELDLHTDVSGGSGSPPSS